MMRHVPRGFERRDKVDIITQVLSALEENGPMPRFRLMLFAEDTSTHFKKLLDRMWAHDLVSVNHLGVSITDKGRKALKIYRGLVDMVRCET